jgi:hypothetical protein
LNLTPRSAIPMGLGAAASTVIAVQTMLVEVAAIAAVPWATRPVPRFTLVGTREVNGLEIGSLFGDSITQDMQAEPLKVRKAALARLLKKYPLVVI